MNESDRKEIVRYRIARAHETLREIDKELGRYYSNIFDKRHTGDYDDFIDYKKDDVLALVKPAKEFVAEIPDNREFPSGILFVFISSLLLLT